jgi:hypothetical protein
VVWFEGSRRAFGPSKPPRRHGASIFPADLAKSFTRDLANAMDEAIDSWLPDKTYLTLVGVAMSVKTICISFAAGMLLAVTNPAVAGVPDELRQDFARAVYSGSPELVHDRNPQPLLRAVVVLNLKLDESDQWQAEVVRTNDQQPAMLARALETVRKARGGHIPEEHKAELKRNGFMEAWLFDNDGTFQVKTLAKAQRRQ